MDPQKIIRHISFYDRKPARKPKMFAGDQMTSRQFGGWKQVTTFWDSVPPNHIFHDFCDIPENGQT